MLLTCGNPDNGPATYTRFILPFAYCPTLYKPASGNEESSNKTYYEEKAPEDQQFPVNLFYSEKQ